MCYLLPRLESSPRLTSSSYLIVDCNQLLGAPQKHCVVLPRLNSVCLGVWREVSRLYHSQLVAIQPRYDRPTHSPEHTFRPVEHIRHERSATCITLWAPCPPLPPLAPLPTLLSNYYSRWTSPYSHLHSFKIRQETNMAVWNFLSP